MSQNNELVLRIVVVSGLGTTLVIAELPWSSKERDCLLFYFFNDDLGWDQLNSARILLKTQICTISTNIQFCHAMILKIMPSQIDGY